MKTQALASQPYGITASTLYEMVTEATSPCGRAVFTMPIEKAHIRSGKITLDGREVLTGGWPCWADKWTDGVFRKWEQLSMEDGMIVNRLLDAVGDGNVTARQAWEESLTYEQAEIVGIANARHAKIVHEVINEGGEGYGSPVAPRKDNTPCMQGDDQPA